MTTKKYEPTPKERAAQHVKKEQSKKWRPQKWKEWVDEDEDQDEQHNQADAF